MARNVLHAVCSKIKTRVLQPFDIELNTQFCPKNVDRMRVFILKQTASNILHAICSKIKT